MQQGVGALKFGFPDPVLNISNQVSGIVGWLRGDPLEEEETKASEEPQIAGPRILWLFFLLSIPL